MGMEKLDVFDIRPLTPYVFSSFEFQCKINNSHSKHTFFPFDADFDDYANSEIESTFFT